MWARASFSPSPERRLRPTLKERRLYAVLVAADPDQDLDGPGRVMPQLRPRRERRPLGQADRLTAWLAWTRLSENMPVADCHDAGAQGRRSITSGVRT